MTGARPRMATKRAEALSALACFCAAVISLAMAAPSLATLPPPPDFSVMVFFRVNASDLETRSTETLKLVNSIAKDPRYRGPILVTGHEDSTEHNVAWGRAHVVTARLIELGIPASRIFVGSRGDLDPLACPGLEVPSTCNARVEVNVCTNSCSDGFRRSTSSRN